MKLTWMQCRLLLLELVQPQSLEDLLKDSDADVDFVDMEETVTPSASTSNEVTHDEDPNLSTAAEISNAPNFDSVEVRPTRPSKPPQLIAEGITNVRVAKEQKLLAQSRRPAEDLKKSRPRSPAPIRRENFSYADAARLQTAPQAPQALQQLGQQQQRHRQQQDHTEQQTQQQHCQQPQQQQQQLSSVQQVIPQVPEQQHKRKLDVTKFAKCLGIQSTPSNNRNTRSNTSSSNARSSNTNSISTYSKNGSTNHDINNNTSSHSASNISRPLCNNFSKCSSLICTMSTPSLFLTGLCRNSTS
ncbi:GH22469 [Drosophila grimshawi]|uniref:GH22469 n=1 Tax=Drosophila grimshawi TaxID=7222 RepID=B4K064_DROGR|nr:GH22469 [Drosophila grimshawi]